MLLLGKLLSEYIKIQTEHGISSEKIAYVLDNKLYINNKTGVIKHQNNKSCYILATASHHGNELNLKDVIELMQIDKENSPKLKIYINSPLKPSINNELNQDFKDLAIIHLLQILNQFTEKEVDKSIKFLNQFLFKAQFFGSSFANDWNNTDNRIDLIFETIERTARILQFRHSNWLKTMPRFYKKSAFKLAKVLRFAHKNLYRFRKTQTNRVVKKFEHSVHKIKPELNTEKEIKKDLRMILRPDFYGKK